MRHYTILPYREQDGRRHEGRLYDENTRQESGEVLE